MKPLWKGSAQTPQASFHGALLLKHARTGTSALDCCLKNRQKVIPSSWVKSYRLQGPESGCSLAVWLWQWTSTNCPSTGTPALAGCSRWQEALRSSLTPCHQGPGPMWEQSCGPEGLTPAEKGDCGGGQSSQQRVFL
uniref:Chemokine interleukin-8-like domain-containing protein n=1 Tax=Strix occidentalis caurina TaxID=311401 RepID=A0A8D0EX37_STROC